MRRVVVALACLAALAAAAPAAAAAASVAARVENLEQELDSLVEEIDDLREPVEEFELFEECMYLIGVSEHGRGRGRAGGYPFTGADGRERHRPVLAFDLRGFDRATFQLLAFPAEEPPSIECNEDAGEEDIDD